MSTKSMTQAIMAVLAKRGEPAKTGDVIAEALPLVKPKPTGLTPKASMSTAVFNLVQKGLVVRPEKGMIALAPQGAGASPEPPKEPAAKKAPPKKSASRSRPPKADASG